MTQRPSRSSTAIIFGTIFLSLAIAIGLGVRYLRANWWYVQTYQLGKKPAKSLLCPPTAPQESHDHNPLSKYYLDSGGDPRLIIFECIIDYPSTLNLWIEKIGNEVGQAAIQVDAEGKTLLELAIEKKDYDLVQDLIDYGADINYTGSILSSNSPVAVAIHNDDMQMIKLLAENGASFIESKGSLEENREAILQELNQSLAQDLQGDSDRWEENINSLIYSYFDGNALAMAITYQKHDIAEYLIDLDVPYDGKADVSPKYVLAEKRIKIIRAMLEGDPVLANSQMLVNAIRIQSMELINLLLSKNVKVDSSAHLATAIEGGDPAVIQLVKTLTPQNLLTDPKLLNAAMKTNNLSEVDYFISQGISLNTSSGEGGKSPFEIALGTGGSSPYESTLIQHLIDRGADVNRIGHEGFTPLTAMVNDRDQEMIDLLLKNGANVNQIDGNGQTPLMIAIQERKVTLVEFLVSRGADVNQPNATGRYPVNEASLSGTGNDKVREYLLSQGGTYSP